MLHIQVPIITTTMKTLQATSLLIASIRVASSLAQNVPSDSEDVKIHPFIETTACVEATDSDGSPVQMWVYFDCINNS